MVSSGCVSYADANANHAQIAPVGRQEEGGSGIETRVTEALGERDAGVS
jgi:hypothetical protein